MGNKMKPHKGLLKRVRVGGKGSIKRNQSGKGHLMSCKNGKRRRHLKLAVNVPKCELGRIRKLLGMG